MSEPTPVTAASLSVYEVEDLARYHGERSRGIMHTPEYAERMAALQDRFDRYNSQFIPAKMRRIWTQRRTWRVLTVRCQRCGEVFPRESVHAC